MAVVDPMANLRVAIQRSARNRSLADGYGTRGYAPQARLVLDVLDATRDLELCAGLLDEGRLMDDAVAQALVSLHLHAARFIEACRNHGPVRAPVDGLLDRATFARLSRAVLRGPGYVPAESGPTSPGPWVSASSASSPRADRSAERFSDRPDDPSWTSTPALAAGPDNALGAHAVGASAVRRPVWPAPSPEFRREALSA